MGRRQLVLAMLSMLSLYFFSFFLRTAVPGTIFNELQSDFRMSAAAVTGLGSGFLYIYAGMQLVVGLAADRFGGTRTLLVGGFIMAVGAAWFPAKRRRRCMQVERLRVLAPASCTCASSRNSTCYLGIVAFQ